MSPPRLTGGRTLQHREPGHEDLESLRQVGQGQADERATERDVSEDRSGKCWKLIPLAPFIKKTPFRTYAASRRKSPTSQVLVRGPVSLPLPLPSFPLPWGNFLCGQALAQK